MTLRVIRPDAKLIEDFVYQQQQLPIDKPVAQYIRQSTMGQVKHNLQSKIQQDEMLSRRLKTMGFIDIRKIALDQGKSGQKLRYQRDGLNELYRLVEHQEVGAIAAYDASRLWRDPTHIWYNDFIEMCKKYHVPVIMFHRIYWMNNQQDEDALREDFRQAAYQLRHIYDKVNPAKLLAIEEGYQLWGKLCTYGLCSSGRRREEILQHL